MKRTLHCLTGNKVICSVGGTPSSFNIQIASTAVLAAYQKARTMDVAEMARLELDGILLSGLTDFYTQAFVAFFAPHRIFDLQIASKNKLCLFVQRMTPDRSPGETGNLKDLLDCRADAWCSYEQHDPVRAVLAYLHMFGMYNTTFRFSHDVACAVVAAAYCNCEHTAPAHVPQNELCINTVPVEIVVSIGEEAVVKNNFFVHTYEQIMEMIVCQNIEEKILVHFLERTENTYREFLYPEIRLLVLFGRVKRLGDKDSIDSCLAFIQRNEGAFRTRNERGILDMAKRELARHGILMHDTSAGRT